MYYEVFQVDTTEIFMMIEEIPQILYMHIFPSPVHLAAIQFNQKGVTQSNDVH